MKTLKYTTLIICSFLLIANCSFAQGVLDDQEFEVKIFEKKRIGDPEKSKGVLLFKEGKVGGNITHDNGFSPAKYTTTSKDGFITEIISFKGTTKGKKDILEFEGVVTGNEIEGTATRKRKGTIRTIYEFKGTLKE